MRCTRLTVGTSLCLMLLGVPVMSHAQAPAPGASAIEVVRFGYAEVTGFIVRAAEMVPEAQYGYRPTSSVRTLGQLIGHIADGNTYYCGRATGANPQWAETMGLSNATRAELIAALRASIAACTAAHSAANASRINHLLANFGHVNHHYGNIVTYLRMLGLTPPSS